MSLDIIIDKLLLSLKNELNKDKNRMFIEDEILKPMVHKIIYQVYPYFIGVSVIFLSMFLFIMIILILNIRIFLHK